MDYYSPKYNLWYLTIKTSQSFWCCCLITDSCLTLCNPMDYSPPSFSVHGIAQARIMEWVAISFFRSSSQSRDQTHVSCIVGGLFTAEPPAKPTAIPLLIWELSTDVKSLSQAQVGLAQVSTAGASHWNWWPTESWGKSRLFLSYVWG